MHGSDPCAREVRGDTAPLVPCQPGRPTATIAAAAAATLRALCMDAASDAADVLHSPVTQLLSWRQARGGWPAEADTEPHNGVTLHELLNAQPSFCRDTALRLHDAAASEVQPVMSSAPGNVTGEAVAPLPRLHVDLERTEQHRRFVCSTYNAVLSLHAAQEDKTYYRSPWSRHLQRPLARLPRMAAKATVADDDEAAWLRTLRDEAALQLDAEMPATNTVQPPYRDFAARLEDILNEALARYMEAYAVTMPVDKATLPQVSVVREREDGAQIRALCNAATAYVKEIAMPGAVTSDSADDTHAPDRAATTLTMAIVVLTYRQQQQQQRGWSDDGVKPRLVCGHRFTCRLLEGVMTVSHECTTLLVLRHDEGDGVLRYCDHLHRASDAVSVGTSSVSPSEVNALLFSCITNELLHRVEAAEGEVGLRLQSRVQAAFAHLAERCLSCLFFYDPVPVTQMQDAKAHIQALKQRFPTTMLVQKSNSASTLLSIEEKIDVSPSTQYTISLLVVLPAGFPRTPPRVTLPDGETEVPITPLFTQQQQQQQQQQSLSLDNRSGEDSLSGWDATQSSLADAVGNALLHVARWWGPVSPPSMATVEPLLRQETDALLQDLVSNHNCLDAYCYQLPMMKQMREVEKTTLDELETAAKENQRLQEEVQKLRVEMQEMQARLRGEVDKLHTMGTNPLLSSVADPQALLRTMEADVRKLNDLCATLGKNALLVHTTDKRAFQDGIGKFKVTAKRMHMLQLKHNIYKAQLNH